MFLHVKFKLHFQLVTVSNIYDKGEESERCIGTDCRFDIL